MRALRASRNDHGEIVAVLVSECAGCVFDWRVDAGRESGEFVLLGLEYGKPFSQRRVVHCFIKKRTDEVTIAFLKATKETA